MIGALAFIFAVAVFVGAPIAAAWTIREQRTNLNKLAERNRELGKELDGSRDLIDRLNALQDEAVGMISRQEKDMIRATERMENQSRELGCLLNVNKEAEVKLATLVTTLNKTDSEMRTAKMELAREKERLNRYGQMQTTSALDEKRVQILQNEKFAVIESLNRAKEEIVKLKARKRKTAKKPTVTKAKK